MSVEPPSAVDLFFMLRIIWNLHLEALFQNSFVKCLKIERPL